MFATNTDPDGGALSAQDRKWYEEAVANAELIDQEYRRAKPQVPNLTFEDELTLHSGQREIRLLHYGRGNTGGDVIMWLPRERILAAGDLVVSPTPFGGGSYPREWAEVLRKMNALGYETLVPGHGEVQHDTRYVDQLIQVLDFVSTEVPALLAAGATQDQLVDRMDFSPFEIRFTGHDEFLQARFRGYFVEPIVEAAYLLETGEQPETKPLPYTPPSEPKVK
jgi:glyoxylase-like metal-dependent hydrolase (beta-lactamase superfamily II)